MLYLFSRQLWTYRFYILWDIKNSGAAKMVIYQKQSVQGSKNQECITHDLLIWYGQVTIIFFTKVLHC